MHMMSCQSLLAAPLDPIMLGLLSSSKKELVVKAYDSHAINTIPLSCKFLAQTEKGSLDVVSTESLSDSSNKGMGQSVKNHYRPRYIYMVDFMLEFRFLTKPNLLRAFNYMEKYPSPYQV